MLRISLCRSSNVFLLVVAALAVVPCLAGAQERRDFRAEDGAITSAFRAEPGVLVEGAGLAQWTLEMVQDSLDASGRTLFADRRTRDTLRSLPFFPQSVVYRSRGDSAVTVFLAVIEDQDIVTVRAFEGDSTQSTAPWAALVELGRAPFNVLEKGVLESIRARATGLKPKLSMTTRADSAELTAVWSALDAHRTVEDMAAARQVLTTSPHVYDRVAAVAVLSNFDNDDAAWHALVGALLDPADIVREHARSVLRAFTTDLTRRVDWAPATAELRAILKGSDLFFLPDALGMLIATGAGPELAGPLLKDGGHAVLVFAGAQSPWARGPAHRFLRVMSGRDGATPAEWEEWIASL